MNSSGSGPNTATILGVALGVGGTVLIALLVALVVVVFLVTRRNKRRSEDNAEMTTRNITEPPSTQYLTVRGFLPTEISVSGGTKPSTK